jgi:bacterioferritin-associated ferredoxin
MDGCVFDGDCDTCLAEGGPVVCRCLGITEDELVSALVTLELRTLRDVRRNTGAGTGCTACHRRIQLCLDAYSPSSSPDICSAR